MHPPDLNIAAMRAELKKNGYALYHYDTAPIHSYPYDAPWLNDEEFNRLYALIRSNTLVDRNRCYALFELVQQIRKIPGEVLEVGCWRGGTAGILTRMLPDRIVYLADTFEGVVKSSQWEHYQDKAHADTSPELVTGFLTRQLGVTNFRLLKGIFPEDTGETIKSVKLSFVHIDVDVYRSAKDAFEFVWPNVSPGGMVVFDDYGFVTACSGVYRFVNEIKNNADNLFIQNLNGHACLIKNPSPQITTSYE